MARERGYVVPVDGVAGWAGRVDAVADIGQNLDAVTGASVSGESGMDTTRGRVVEASDAEGGVLDPLRPQGRSAFGGVKDEYALIVDGLGPLRVPLNRTSVCMTVLK